MDEAQREAIRQYHLRELDLARRGARIIPKIPDGCRRILDVGCGAGQTLMTCNTKGAMAVGIEYDLEPLVLGKELQHSGQGAPVELVRGSGETLPFPSASFDFVLSRVALPYMSIPVALTEIARVLRPGGEVWLTLHPLSMLSWTHAMRSVRALVFELYRVTNTACLHWLGWQFRYPLQPARIESYQTPEGMRRALHRAGFCGVRVEQGTHFCVRAVRS